MLERTMANHLGPFQEDLRPYPEYASGFCCRRDGHLSIVHRAPDAESASGRESPRQLQCSTGPAGGTIPLAESLGVRFIPGSSSTVLIERDGKTYLVDLADRTIQEQDSPSMPSAITATHLDIGARLATGGSDRGKDFRRQLRSLPRG